MLKLRTTYREAIKAAVAAQQQNSQVLDLPAGRLEYALAGTGNHHVLIAHSAMGAYDQSLATGRRFPQCRIIAPSRAGYLRTALQTGSTPAQMADSFAALLDALAVECVLMVGFSAGGMSAVEFALRHTDRCCGLVLGAAITQPLPAYVRRVLAPLALSLRSDFLNWVVSSTARRTVVPLRAADEDTRHILSALLRANPASHRWAGYELDIAQARTFCPPLERIRVPTLLIHGTRDVLVPYVQAQQAAQRIPNAQLLTLRGGQHDAPVLYPRQVLPRLQAFVEAAFAQSCAGAVPGA